jgi:hypothetical protein
MDLIRAEEKHKGTLGTQTGNKHKQETTAADPCPAAVVGRQGHVLIITAAGGTAINRL